MHNTAVDLGTCKYNLSQVSSILCYKSGVFFMGHRQNAATRLGLFCLLTSIPSKNLIKLKNVTTDAHNNENGLPHRIRRGKYIRFI